MSVIWRPSRAVPRSLDAREHDLVDVEEAVLLKADVDERGLQPGEHVVHAPFVDVPDDRAVAFPLEVKLGDVVTSPRLCLLASLARRRARLTGGDRAGRFEQRDAGFPAVDADQYLLLQLSFSPLMVRPRAPGGPEGSCVGPRARNGCRG